MNNIPNGYLLVIALYSLIFGFLVIEFTKSVILGAGIGMLFSMYLITKFEKMIEEEK